MKPRLCSRLAHTSKRSTRRQRPADDPRVPHLLNSISRQRSNKRKKMKKKRTNYNTLQFHTSAGTPGQCQICSVHVPPVYVQFMYLSASMRRYLAGGIYRRYCRYMYSSVPVPVQTFVPVPDASLSSVRHQYRYRKLRQIEYDISIPAPETSVSSVRHHYRYRRYRYILPYRCRTLR